MSKYKLKKIKLAEYERKSEEDLSINGDEEQQLSEACTEASDDSDEAPEEVTFSTSRKATLQTARKLHENLRDIKEREKEKRKRIQERNKQQKLEKQKAVQVSDKQSSSEIKTVSKTAFSDDDDEDDEIDDDDDDDDKQTDNLSDGDNQVESTEDKDFIPLTRGIKVVPLTKKISAANSALNFRQQSLYGNRIKRESAKNYFMKHMKKKRR